MLSRDRPPSPQQWRRFKLWLDCEGDVRATAKADHSQPEIIRRAVAAVHSRLKE